MFKIFVGNLSAATTGESIRRLFSRHAEVEDVAVPVDPETGKIRGFAIVMIKDERQAKGAMIALRGTRLEGKALVINQARKKGDPIPPKRQRRSGRFRRGGGGGGGSGGAYSGGQGGQAREQGGAPGYGGGYGNRPPRTFGSRPPVWRPETRGPDEPGPRERGPGSGGQPGGG